MTLTVHLEKDAPASRRTSVSGRWKRMLQVDPESHHPGDPSQETPSTNLQGRARVRSVFQRVVSAMHVTGVMKPDASERRDSATEATKHITIPNPQPTTDHSGDPMRLLCCRIRPKWVMDPSGDRFYYWLSIVSVAILYNTVSVMPRSVFVELDEGMFTFFLFADYISDVLYIIDIGFRMVCGYLEDGVMIQEPRKLIRHYLRSKGAVIDIISILPTDIVFAFTGIHAPYPFIRVNRMLKYYRFNDFFSRLESRTNYPDVFRLINLMTGFIIIMHLNACLFYFISDQYGLNSDGWVYPADADWRKTDANETNADDSLFRKYIWSYYWSLQTLTLIGQVKQPEYEGEFLFVTINFLVGVIVYACIVGNVSRAITNMNAAVDEFRSRMDQIKQYMTMRRINESLQERVIRHFEYQWSNKRFANESQAVACLPDKLEAELALQVHLETLQHVQIFQDVEPGLLADLVLKLKLEIYSPGDFICRKGDIGKEMYIVKRGKLEVVADNGHTVFATLGEGSVFGEISILNIVGIKTGNRRTANVRSVGYSDLFCLSKEALWDALREYPEAKKKMLEIGKQMLLKDGLLDEEVAGTAELRQDRFIDKIEKVEKDIDVLLTRFARLVAEEKSSMQKLRFRVERLREIVRTRKEILRSQGIVFDFEKTGRTLRCKTNYRLRFLSFLTNLLLCS